MSNSPRILISGYYGCGNIGDEAILGGLLAGFRRLCPEAAVVVLSADPAATSAEYGVEAIPRFSLKAFWRELARAQLFVSGGGGLLQDTTSWRSPLYYLALLRLARRRRVPSAALCQGIGPLRRGWVKRLVARTLLSTDLIVVRDEASVRLLAEMGLPLSSIHLGADAAWLLDPSSGETAEALLREKGLGLTGAMIGLFLRRVPKSPLSSSRELWEAIAAALGEFLGRHRARAVFVPMQRPGDVEVGEEVMRRLKGEVRQLRGLHLPADLLALSGCFQLAVGMRLHGLIFAARMGVPLLGISYDPKIDAFLSQAGLKAAMSVDSARADALLEALEQTWKGREEFPRNLAALTEESRQKALSAVEMALGLIG